MSETTMQDVTAQLPASAKARLKGLRSAAHPTSVFTSDLSVNEFLLVRKAGFEPIGLCVGSSIYHVGIQYGSWNKNQELEVLSQAMYHARELAMSRMREEARGMGADGIVGVRLEIKHVEWDADILEFVAIGTGVVHNHDTKGFRAHDGGPFTSDLSGQDFYTLLNSGYRPIELVMGSVCTTLRTAACGRHSVRRVPTSNWSSSRRQSTVRANWQSSGCRSKRKLPGPKA
ncbi:YbjQ family protein [Caballeronia sp. ATUFL_M2_KS44]|uniref:heavy metal-binding domain-containing protein n=1 Tax=Caballeronia sp. ATUFL_M2_KS44 TaxID=2921767 RepID=UPI002028C991|nr:YbjQ family protein [Caballeronia sp. ATUFL_M2_KS44]